MGGDTICTVDVLRAASWVDWQKKLIFVNTVLPGTNADIPLSDSQVVSKNVEGVHIARLASQRPDLEK